MRYRILRLPDIRVSMGGDISVQCIGRFAILKATTGKVTEMNAIDTKQRILDAVDANFDAQLATTRDFVAIPSTRGAEGPCQDMIGELLRQRGSDVILRSPHLRASRRMGRNNKSSFEARSQGLA